LDREEVGLVRVERADLQVATLRARAKAQFPSVLLTLTSIIQAIALESLWSRFSELAEPDGFLAIPVEAWLQSGAMLLAIMVLWIYYAQLVMRLVWVPRLADSLIPFALGVAQFLEIDTLGREDVALWLAPFPVIFLLCFAGWNLTIARAGDESENADLMATFRPENGLVRYGPMLGSVVFLMLLAACVWRWPGSSTAALISLDLLLVLHLWLQGRYWRESVLRPNNGGRADREPSPPTDSPAQDVSNH
jgi:hypothetical protein